MAAAGAATESEYLLRAVAGRVVVQGNCNHCCAEFWYNVADKLKTDLSRSKLKR